MCCWDGSASFEGEVEIEIDFHGGIGNEDDVAGGFKLIFENIFCIYLGVDFVGG